MEVKAGTARRLTQRTPGSSRGSAGYGVPPRVPAGPRGAAASGSQRRQWSHTSHAHFTRSRGHSPHIYGFGSDTGLTGADYGSARNVLCPRAGTAGRPSTPPFPTAGEPALGGETTPRKPPRGLRDRGDSVYTRDRRTRSTSSQASKHLETGDYVSHLASRIHYIIDMIGTSLRAGLPITSLHRHT